MGRGRPHKCPYCGATRTVAKGFRHNKTGIVKLRRCKVCKRLWTTGPANDANRDKGVADLEINHCAGGCAGLGCMPNGIAQQHESTNPEALRTDEARKGQNEPAEDEKTQRE